MVKLLRYTDPAMPVAVKTPAAPLTVLPAPLGVDVNWHTEEFDYGMIARAYDQTDTLRGFVLLGAYSGQTTLEFDQISARLYCRYRNKIKTIKG